MSGHGCLEKLCYCASVMVSPATLLQELVLPNIICEFTIVRRVGGLICEVEGKSVKISKQLGLLPLSVVWEMFECPNMLIPSNPAPEELLITTCEMITLYVCRK